MFLEIQIIQDSLFKLKFNINIFESVLHAFMNIQMLMVVVNKGIHMVAFQLSNL